MPARSSLVLALLLAAPLALAQDAPLFTSDFPPEEFAARRAKVYDAIGKEAVALVQGAPAPEGYLRFRQSNDFYYLCGVEVPHAYLLLDGASRRATLFLPHRNERRERSEGKVLSAEDAELVTKLTGVEAVAGTDLLGETLARYGQRGATKAALRAPPAGRGALGEPRRGPARGGGDGQRPLRRAAVAGGRPRPPPARPLPLDGGPQPHSRARRGAPRQEPAGDRAHQEGDAPRRTLDPRGHALDRARDPRARARRRLALRLLPPRRAGRGVLLPRRDREERLVPALLLRQARRCWTARWSSWTTRRTSATT